jgi:broad specificity phosphatase PhoE
MIIHKKFYFARHGKTEWNEKKLCQGQVDIELSEAGRLEAKFLGESIKSLAFSRICVSPLKRALETAMIIQNIIPSSKIQIIDELKERGWGKLEGISSEEMYRIEELEEKDLGYYPGNNVEPREAFKSRILRGINIALEQEENVPLIVSHGRVFLSLCDILNVPLLRQVPNTTLIECVPLLNKGWQISYLKD